MPTNLIKLLDSSKTLVNSLASFNEVLTSLILEMKSGEAPKATPRPGVISSIGEEEDCGYRGDGANDPDSLPQNIIFDVFVLDESAMLLGAPTIPDMVWGVWCAEELKFKNCRISRANIGLLCHLPASYLVQYK